MSKEYDKELHNITAKQRADREISSLKGILLGINLDNIVNEKEIKELQKWCFDNDEFIKREPFNEFMRIIKNQILNNTVSPEIIEELFWLCQKYESDNYYYDGVTTDLQTLQGICHGILSDGTITEVEVLNFNKWLEENEHLSSYYPYDEIITLISSILEDNKVGEEEKLLLKAYFNQNNTVGEQIKKETIDVRITGICAKNPNIYIDGKIFCITGTLKRCAKDKLYDDIIKLGGIKSENITKKVDYLIVGDAGSQAWKFQCYGGKIERAIYMRKEGHTIMIIRENDFVNFIDNLL